MQYGWRVPHNTQSIVVREVCQAIVDEYMPEVMTCPTTPEGWHAISDKFLEKWNFPHTCGALDGKHIACKCPPKSGSQYFNYKGFYSVVLMALVDAEKSSPGQTSVLQDQHQMHRSIITVNSRNC